MALGCIGGGAGWLVSACVGMRMRDGRRQKMLVIISTYVKSCLPGCCADTSCADVAVDTVECKERKKKQENHLPMVLGFDADGWGDGRREW